MGAEIVLTAAREKGSLYAVVAEGAGVRTWRDYRDLPKVDWPASPPFLMAVTLAGFLSAADEPPALTSVFKGVHSPVLLISADVDQERQMNRLLSELGRPNVDLWEIPEPAHTRALSLHAAQYEAKVVGFFDCALLR
jgi:hypothetical protein